MLLYRLFFFACFDQTLRPTMKSCVSTVRCQNKATQSSPFSGCPLQFPCKFSTSKWTLPLISIAGLFLYLSPAHESNCAKTARERGFNDLQFTLIWFHEVRITSLILLSVKLLGEALSVRALIKTVFFGMYKAFDIITLTEPILLLTFRFAWYSRSRNLSLIALLSSSIYRQKGDWNCRRKSISNSDEASGPPGARRFAGEILFCII